MSYGNFGGYFIDSCILLPQSIESLKKSCDNFLLKNIKNCYISSTVKDEGIDLLNRCYSAVFNHLRESLKPYLAENKISEISNRDGKIFAEFFSMSRREIQKVKTRSNVKNELLGNIENYVANRLHSLKSGDKIKVDFFISAMMRELSTRKHKLLMPFKKITCISIVPNSALKCLMISAANVRNQHDAEHLVSAVTHQFTSNNWMIFVTNDEDHIISNRDEIMLIFALECSKPEWAKDYFRDITKRKKPTDYYKEIKNYTKNQVTFAENLKKDFKKDITGSK